jgi:2'-5' RNA ligase
MTDARSVRAFVAFEIPERVRETIRRDQRALKDQLPRARWTRPEGQHLTLRFLGETPLTVLDALRREITSRVRGLPSVVVKLGGSGFFPNPRRPRVAWIGGEAAGGGEVAAAVEDAAVACGLDAERRSWSLHLTLARLDRPWPRPAVERYLSWGQNLDLASFECSEVVLFESDLRPGGAVYTALERFELS